MCYKSFTMRARTAWLVLIALAAASFFAPLLSASSFCTESGDSDCCELECAVCACCSHLPRTIVPDSTRVPLVSPSDEVHGETASACPEPLPRKIFHVPRLPA